MAAGDAFSETPQEVEVLEPEYHNVITPTESMKKEYLNLSATPVEKYRLRFKARTNTQRETIHTHYKDQSGGYYLFSWQSVPSYIGGGANISGRWVEGSFGMTPVGATFFNIELIFEKDN